MGGSSSSQNVALSRGNNVTTSPNLFDRNWQANINANANTQNVNHPDSNYLHP